MGWSSGTNIAILIEDIILEYVPKEKRIEVAKKALTVLEYQDWDCQEEVGIFELLQLQRDIKESWIDKEVKKEYKKRIKELEKNFNKLI